MRPQPVLGFARKKAAVAALFAQGAKPSDIATRIGTTPAAVHVTIKKLRKAGELPPSAHPRSKAQPPSKVGAEPGQWTGEKRDKVRRLFGRTMILIAEAVDVPPAELLKFVLHGVIPPSQKIVEDTDIGWRDRPQLEAPPAPSAAEPPEPDEEPAPPAPAELHQVRDALEQLQQAADARDADAVTTEAIAETQAHVEAAIASAQELPPLRDASSELTPGEPAPTSYRLQHEDGQFLRKDGIGLTRDLGKAWKGTAQQCERIFKRLPQWKELDQVRAP